jgi:hypothetical protein
MIIVIYIVVPHFCVLHISLLVMLDFLSPTLNQAGVRDLSCCSCVPATLRPGVAVPFSFLELSRLPHVCGKLVAGS